MRNATITPTGMKRENTAENQIEKVQRPPFEEGKKGADAAFLTMGEVPGIPFILGCAERTGKLGAKKSQIPFPPLICPRSTVALLIFVNSKFKM